MSDLAIALITAFGARGCIALTMITVAAVLGMIAYGLADE